MKFLTALTVLVLATPAFGQTVTFRSWTDHDGITHTQFSDGTWIRSYPRPSDGTIRHQFSDGSTGQSLPHRDGTTQHYLYPAQPKPAPVTDWAAYYNSPAGRQELLRSIANPNRKPKSWWRGYR